MCDGERDCPGGDDEKAEKCKNSVCAAGMFRCPSGKCIFSSWVSLCSIIPELSKESWLLKSITKESVVFYMFIS